jgi:hypothetical protein
MFLETLRDLTATKPRDKMYAAVSTINATAPRIAFNMTGHEDPMQCLDGISSPEGVKSSNTPHFQHPSIKPRAEWMAIDYRRNYEPACIDTAEALNFSKDFVGVSHFSLLMVEDSGSQRPGEVAEKYLSSWVPDWRSTHQVIRLNTTESTFRACNGDMADRHILKTASSWLSKAALWMKWIKLRVIYPLVAGTTSITRVAPILSSFCGMDRASSRAFRS